MCRNQYFRGHRLRTADGTSDDSVGRMRVALRILRTNAVMMRIKAEISPAADNAGHVRRIRRPDAFSRHLPQRSGIEMSIEVCALKFFKVQI